MMSLMSFVVACVVTGPTTSVRPIVGTLDGDIGLPENVTFKVSATPADAATGADGLFHFVGWIGKPDEGTHADAEMVTGQLDTTRFELVDVDGGHAILKDMRDREAPVYFGVTVTKPTNDLFSCHARRILEVEDDVWTPEFTMSIRWNLAEPTGAEEPENADTVAEYVAIEVLASMLVAIQEAMPR